MFHYSRPPLTPPPFSIKVSARRTWHNPPQVAKDVPNNDSKRIDVAFLVPAVGPAVGPKKKAKGGPINIEICIRAHVDDLEVTKPSKVGSEAECPGGGSGAAASSGGAAAPGKKVAEKKTVFDTYPWLPAGSEAPTVIEGWERLQCKVDKPDSLVGLCKAKATIAMHLLNENNAQSAEDILLVRRGKIVEAYALRDLKKGQLFITPYTSEVKDRYWTLNRLRERYICACGDMEEQLIGILWSYAMGSKALT